MSEDPLENEHLKGFILKLKFKKILWPRITKLKHDDLFCQLEKYHILMVFDASYNISIYKSIFYHVSCVKSVTQFMKHLFSDFHIEQV